VKTEAQSTVLRRALHRISSYEGMAAPVAFMEHRTPSPLHGGKKRKEKKEHGNLSLLDLSCIFREIAVLTAEPEPERSPRSRAT